MSSDQISGYTVAYEQEELQFPVVLMAIIGFLLLAGGILHDLPLLLLLAMPVIGGVIFNIPLLETGRARLGAGQYGLFLEGLGLIDWRAIDMLDLVNTDLRGSVSQALVIELKVPVERALILDWRKTSPIRNLMRRAWKWSGPQVIRVPLDVMDKPAEDIHKTLRRMWRFYR